MMNAWDLENEVEGKFSTLRNRYNKEYLKNLKINLKRPVFSFKKFLD